MSSQIPPALTERGIPTNGQFEVVFWPPKDRPYLVYGLKANRTVGLTHMDSGRAFGYATIDSGRLWAAFYYEQLTEIWEAAATLRQRMADSEAADVQRQVDGMGSASQQEEGDGA